MAEPKTYVTADDILLRYRRMRTPPGVELSIILPIRGWRHQAAGFVELAIELVQLSRDSQLGTVELSPSVPVTLCKTLPFDLRDDEKACSWNDRMVFDLFVELAEHQAREWLVLEDGRYLRPPHDEACHPVIGKETT